MLMGKSGRHVKSQSGAPDIEDRWPCYRCGYDLRGMPLKACCPECGVGVAASQASWRNLSVGRAQDIRVLMVVGSIYLLATLGCCIVLPLHFAFVDILMPVYWIRASVLPSLLCAGGIVFLCRDRPRRTQAIGCCLGWLVFCVIAVLLNVWQMETIYPTV